MTTIVRFVVLLQWMFGIQYSHAFTVGRSLRSTTVEAWGRTELFTSSKQQSDEMLTTTSNLEEHDEDSTEVESPVHSSPSSRANEGDARYMQMALDLASKGGGERGPRSAFPAPTVGAVLVGGSGTTVLGAAASDYRTEAIRQCLKNAGYTISHDGKNWSVSSSNDDDEDITTTATTNGATASTLYVTLEPSTRRRGTAMPPITDLIATVSGSKAIERVVIGCLSPVPEKSGRGADALRAAGLQVDVLTATAADCQELIREYSALSNCKLQRMAREQFHQSGRPLGFLHCSVIESDNVEAFARHGNAFGTNFGTTRLSYRDFGSYELAPPPDVLWADDDDDEMYDVEFEEEVSNEEDDFAASSSPIIMPWYEQADAVVVTFPRPGNGPTEDNSVKARLAGVKWLAAQDSLLPAGVERIVVMDATELASLPLTNDDPNLPEGVDVEKFWEAEFRKPTRIILRRGVHEASRAAATAASQAAQAAAEAAQAAAEAVETGDVEKAAIVAQESQRSAEAAAALIQKELEVTQARRKTLEDMGVLVESLEGQEPIDVMNYLGQCYGLYTVVWRAGCWGNRGVKSILEGAFQCVSAHLAVDAIGGQFWQLIIAENAIQAACGPRSQVQVLADDISLEYCDDPAVDTDCNLTVDDGRPVRLVRVDCRIGLVDDSMPPDIMKPKTEKLNRKRLLEQAPWFL